MAKIPRRIKDSVDWHWRTLGMEELLAAKDCFLRYWARNISWVGSAWADRWWWRRKQPQEDLSIFWEVSRRKVASLQYQSFRETNSLQCLQIFGQLQIWNSYSNSSISVTYEPELASSNRTGPQWRPRSWSSQTAGCKVVFTAPPFCNIKWEITNKVDERKFQNESMLKDSFTQQIYVL